MPEYDADYLDSIPTAGQFESLDLEGQTIDEMARSGVPRLIQRAFTLSMGSNNLKDVLSVLKEFADRGYGKVTDRVSVDMNVGISEILRDIDGLTSGLPDAEERRLVEFYANGGIDVDTAPEEDVELTGQDGASASSQSQDIGEDDDAE